LKFDILSYLSSGYRATTTAFCSARRVCVCVCVCEQQPRQQLWMERDCKGSCNSLAAEKRRAQLFSALGNTALRSVWFLEAAGTETCINTLVYALWTWVREYNGKYIRYECVYV